MTHFPISRRSLLGASALSSLGFLLQPRSGWAGDAPKAVEALPSTPVLLCVFLRGAADGLNIVVPHADANYYKLRRGIALKPPGQDGGVIDLDGRFGLHPRLLPLKAAYDAKELALVHAVGSPHDTRSHFEAQDYMETARVGDRSATSSWLGSYLSTRPCKRRERCAPSRYRGARRWPCAAIATLSSPRTCVISGSAPRPSWHRS